MYLQQRLTQLHTCALNPVKFRVHVPYWFTTVNGETGVFSESQKGQVTPHRPGNDLYSILYFFIFLSVSRLLLLLLRSQYHLTTFLPAPWGSSLMKNQSTANWFMIMSEPRFGSHIFSLHKLQLLYPIYNKQINKQLNRYNDRWFSWTRLRPGRIALLM